MSKSRKGKPVLKRKTSSKKLSASLKRMDEWMKANRHGRIGELIGKLNQKLRGHYGYYGITFNSRKLGSYYEQTKRTLHKWLNRRGGKRPIWNWEQFTKLSKEWIPLLEPKIYHSYQWAKPWIEEPYAGKLLVRICGGAGRQRTALPGNGQWAISQ